MPTAKPPPNNPPPDLVMFVAAKLGDPPVEIAHADYVHFTPTALTVRLAEGAPAGAAEALREKLRAAFPGREVSVI